MTRVWKLGLGGWVQEARKDRLETLSILTWQQVGYLACLIQRDYTRMDIGGTADRRRVSEAAGDRLHAG